MIGCFSAASNITGILTDVDSVTECLHRHGALAFWDYATAAPYVKVDMHPVRSRYVKLSCLFCFLIFVWETLSTICVSLGTAQFPHNFMLGAIVYVKYSSVQRKSNK